MAGLTMHAPVPLDLGSLFGTRLYEADWQNSRTSTQTHTSSREIPLEFPQHRKATTDRRPEKREPLLQALFGHRNDDEFDEETEAVDGIEDGSDLAQPTLKDLFARDAPFSEILDYLRDSFDVDRANHKLLEFLDFTQDRQISVKQFADYAGCVEAELVLGTMDMAQLESFLNRIEPWITGRWSENDEHASIVLILTSTWLGVKRCRVQTPDTPLLHRLRLKMENASKFSSCIEEHVFDIYRACWPFGSQVDYMSQNLERQIMHWLDLAFLSSLKPEVQDTRFMFKHHHLVVAVKYLCNESYSHRPQTRIIHFDGIQPSTAHQKEEFNLIQSITSTLCRKTTLNHQSDVDVKEVNFLRRETWLQALFRVVEFTKDVQSMLSCSLDGKTHAPVAYVCYSMYFDIIDTVTKYLPLHCAVRHLQKSGAEHHCRLALIFSFGPQSDGRRLSMVPYLKGVSKHDAMKRCEAALQFELSLRNSINVNENSAYALFLSAVTKSRPLSTSYMGALLVPALRVASILHDTQGEKAVLSFLVSPEFKKVLGHESSKAEIAFRRACMLPKLAAMTYDHQKFFNSRNHFLSECYRIVSKDIIKWHRLSKTPSRALKFKEFIPIYREWPRNNYDRFLTHLAEDAARDESIGNGSSYVIVDFLRMQAIAHGLRLTTQMQDAILQSGVLRRLRDEDGVATLRARHVFNVLERSGATRDELSHIKATIDLWLRDIQLRRNKKRLDAHFSNLGTGANEASSRVPARAPSQTDISKSAVAIVDPIKHVEDAVSLTSASPKTADVPTMVHSPVTLHVKNLSFARSSSQPASKPESWPTSRGLRLLHTATRLKPKTTDDNEISCSNSSQVRSVSKESSAETMATLKSNSENDPASILEATISYDTALDVNCSSQPTLYDKAQGFQSAAMRNSSPIYSRKFKAESPQTDNSPRSSSADCASATSCIGSTSLVSTGLIRYVELDRKTGPERKSLASGCPKSGKRLSLLAHFAKKQLKITRRKNDFDMRDK